jgi:hypothetical protein
VNLKYWFVIHMEVVGVERSAINDVAIKIPVDLLKEFKRDVRVVVRWPWLIGIPRAHLPTTDFLQLYFCFSFPNWLNCGKTVFSFRYIPDILNRKTN